ncbi:MAG TPA: efflux RND transporter periplasmic adaptor subunit [Gemmatimonadales bacterium]|jgi:RND family efflux transporter MFP subunit|nr:efflux RND transporter periplasmic adaptor subunit [Gemmatimonadales bacterium]
MSRRVQWALGGLALIAGCHSGGDEEAEVVPRVPVGVATAVQDTLSEGRSVVGRLGPAPGGSALLTAPAAGVVSQIPVQVGTRVAKGQLLLSLDVPDLVNNARALGAAADIAEKDAQRQEQLLSEGITSAKQAEQRRAEAVGARAQANAAQQLLARARVTSPLAGGVQQVMVHPGERVDAGAQLVEVIDPSVLDLLALVPAAQLVGLKVGQAVTVTPDGSTDAFPGTLRAIAPGVDSLTNAAQVVIRVPNAHGALRSGAGATATVLVGKSRPAIVVPDSAIVVVGDSLSVFVVEHDTLARVRSVTVGVRRAGRAEIKAGLAAGEVVVTSGAFGLTDGMRVVPAKPDKP